METGSRWYASPLGRILLTACGDALTGLRFEDAQPSDPVPSSEEAQPVLDQAVQWLDLYFSGLLPPPAPPLLPKGTPFQQEVWAMLHDIPRGQTLSYGALAARLAVRSGRAVSARAVGQAVGSNPILLMIPCHRVIGADGGLTGYAGGLERKQRLLDLEREPLPGAI